MASPPPANTPTAAPWQASPAARLAGPVLFAGLLLTTLFGLSTLGLPSGVPSLMGVVAAGSALVGGLITPTLYLLGAFGLGRPLAAALARGSGSRLHLQLALGTGAMLWVSHAMGVLGLLSEMGPLGAGSRYAAWGAVGVGLLLLAHQVIMGELRPEKWPVFPLGLSLWAPALGVTAIAACNPAGGGLWASEFGAYDVLSYHLQLAKEWAAGPVGRIWPVDHNVYSYLPSYLESAFTHLAAMSLGRGNAPERMVGDESHWVYACQFLHMGMGVACAVLTARLVRVLAERAGVDPRIAGYSGVAAAALLLGTPWTVVVGSLGYNELAMLAMMAGAMLAAADRALGPSRRGLVVGLLVGIACSAKPTALMLVGPAVGVALLGLAVDRERIKGAAIAVVAGCVGGLAAIGPWLVRNALASGGNPVFPFAGARLGRGRWTDEQITRHARAHFADLGYGERLWLLVSKHGHTPTEQARGLGHEQWAFVPWMALAGLAIVLLWRPTRRAGLVLAVAMMVQIAAWMAFTHVQSRFLMPLIVPMAAAFGLGAGAALTLATRRMGAPAPAPTAARVPALAAVVIGILPLTAAGWAAINFVSQLGAHPNLRLALGAGGLSGMNFEANLLSASEQDRERFLAEIGPTAYVNLTMRGAERTPAAHAGEADDLYLLGDATPLYYLDALGETPEANRAKPDPRPLKVHYHTTWDASPLGDAIAAHPNDPAAWSAWMRHRGVGHVLVNYSELARLIEKDRNYDPRVTTAAIGQWVAPGGPGGLKSVRRWMAPADPSGRTQYVATELFRIEEGGRP